MSNRSDENGQSTSQTQKTKQGQYRIYLNIGLMIFFDAVLPIILYFVLKKYIRETYALIISSIPPFFVAVFGFVRRRRADVLGIILVFSFVISAIVVALRDDPRIHLLRRSAVTGIIGVIFLITLIPIKIGSFRVRPLVFYFAKDMATGGAFGNSSSSSELTGLTEDEPVDERWDRYWNSYPLFRHGFIVMTAVWGIGLLSEVPVRVIVVYKVTPFEKAYFASQVITYVWMGSLALFNILYVRRMKKRGVRAADAANDTAEEDKSLE